MAHTHTNNHGGSSANLRIAFFLNLGFTLFEVVGGFWTNSIAILTDALHDFGDSASLGLAWYFDRISHRGRTPLHTYGYKRYRLLGGLVTGILLVFGLGIILWNAFPRLIAPETVHAPGMVFLAVIGIAINGAAVLRLKKGSSLTERIVSWHLLEDTLGWVAVLLGAALMTVWGLPIIDPILSIGISVFVLWNVGRNLIAVMKVFLQTAPESFDLNAFETQLQGIPGVRNLHHVHVWSLDGESHVLSGHLVMDKGATRDEIVTAKRLAGELLDKDEFAHVTIEVELEGEECASSREGGGQGPTAFSPR